MFTKSGQSISAVYGFTRKLAQFDELFPGYKKIAVFDSPGPTTRTASFPEYKMQRPSMPLNLRAEMLAIQEGCECLGATPLALPGVEADDLIASLVTLARSSAASEVVIVSTDKDLLQLVSPASAVTSVQVWNDHKKVFFDHDAVVEKLGVPPALIADLLAMVGDTVDNVPGIPGIGPKTAVKLLTEYGTLENVLANAPSMAKSKRQQALVEHAVQARVSKQLIQLMHDVMIDPEVLSSTQTCISSCDKDRLREFLTRYELNQLQKRLKL